MSSRTISVVPNIRIVVCQAPLSMGFFRQENWSELPCPPSRGSSQPRDQTQVSFMGGDSLLSEPPGKPKNTGVGSLSILQRIFLTQESNRGLLHHRQILYQLSYQGSPSNKAILKISVRIFLISNWVFLTGKILLLMQ